MPLTVSEKAKAVKPSSTLAFTAKANELKAKGVDIVGFTAGEPDFNTPDNINQAAIKAIEDGFTKYTPVPGIPALRKAISDKFKKVNSLDYAPEQIVVSNGGKHSLTNVFTAILNPGDEVIIPTPFWLSYPEIIKLAGGVPVFVECDKANDYKITVAQLEDAVTPNTKAMILNSPNNPTGAVYTQDELQAIADFVVANDFYVISDEIYEALVYGDTKQVSIATLGKDIYDRTITVNGLAKGYAMTGWRIGYTGSSLELAKIMSSVQSHQTSNANSIAQKAAVEALTGPQESVGVMKKAFEERREYIYKRMLTIPYMNPVNPTGAFYLFVDISEVIGRTYKGQVIDSCDQMAMILLEEYNVVVVTCGDFGAPMNIRLSYAISMERIQKGLDRIEAFVNELN